MLLKNVIQTLRRKWLQLLAAGIIMFFSAFIQSSMFYTMYGLEQPTLDYLDEYQQEDFAIEMLSVLTIEEIAYLRTGSSLPSEIYQLTDLAAYDWTLLADILERRLDSLKRLFPELVMEVRQFKDFYFSSNGEEHRALLIREGQAINRSYIEHGTYPSGKDEIALTGIYARNNDLDIGDLLLVNDNYFRISGFVLFPDYTYAVFDNSIFVDNSKVTLLLTDDQIFMQKSGQAGFRVAGIFADERQRAKYERALLELPSASDSPDFILSVALTENQFRSGAIFDEFKSARIFGNGLGLMIAAIAVFIVALILSRVISSQRRQIGVLKALGYSRWEIGLPHLLVILVFALPMLLAGYFAGYLAGPRLQSLMLDFYLIPSGETSHALLAMASAILLPLGVFTICGIIVMSRLLSDSPVNLLYVHRNETINRLTRFASRLLAGKSSRSKFKYLYILQNTMKFFIFLLCVVFTTVLLLAGWMMNGMVDRMTLDYYNQVGYEYEAYIDPALVGHELESGQERFLVYPNVFWGDASVTAVGLETDNKLHNLFSLKGENITGILAEKPIISKSLSLKRQACVGDDIQLKIGSRLIETQIGGVANDYSSDRIFMSIETLSLIISDGDRDDLFSGVYTESKPADDTFAIILSKQSIMAQIGLLQQFFQFVVYFLIGSSMAIAILIILALSAQTIEDNHYNISLLKVIGYSRKEVNDMVLNSYLIYMLVSYMASLPLAVFILSWVRTYFATAYNLVMPFQFHWSHALISLIILFLVYFAGTGYSRYKIAKIPLQEILKKYTE